MGRLLLRPWNWKTKLYFDLQFLCLFYFLMPIIELMHFLAGAPPNKRKTLLLWFRKLMAGFDRAYVVTYYWLLSTHRGLRQLAMATLLAWSCALNFHSWNESMIFWLPEPQPKWQESQSGKPVSPSLDVPKMFTLYTDPYPFIWRWLLLCDKMYYLFWDGIY